MITAAPRNIGETGSVSTGPMLALNGISRKFQKLRDGAGRHPDARTPGGLLPRRASVMRCSPATSACPAFPWPASLTRRGYQPREASEPRRPRPWRPPRWGHTAGPSLLIWVTSFGHWNANAGEASESATSPTTNSQDETIHCLTSLTSAYGSGSRREYILVCDYSVHEHRPAFHGHRVAADPHGRVVGIGACRDVPAPGVPGADREAALQIPFARAARRGAGTCCRSRRTCRPR